MVSLSIRGRNINFEKDDEYMTPKHVWEDSLIDITHTNEHRLKVGTLFSGIGAFEHALQRLNIEHDIVFACDKDEYVKTSYFGNYNIKEDQWYNDVKKLLRDSGRCLIYDF